MNIPRWVSGRGDEYFKRRYEYATEYLDLLRRLWRDERVTHNSDFFSFDDCKSYPKPAREIPIICAGQSDRGINFTAQYADFGFLGGQDDSLEDLGRLNRKLQGAAGQFGRTVGAYVLLTVIAEESDAAAFAKRDAFIETSDRPAMAEWARVAGMDFSRATYQDLAVQTFMAIPYVAGAWIRPWPTISTDWRKTASPAFASSSRITSATCNVWCR